MKTNIDTPDGNFSLSAQSKPVSAASEVDACFWSLILRNRQDSDFFRKRHLPFGFPSGLNGFEAGLIAGTIVKKVATRRHCPQRVTASNDVLVQTVILECIRRNEIHIGAGGDIFIVQFHHVLK